MSIAAEKDYYLHQADNVMFAEHIDVPEDHWCLVVDLEREGFQGDVNNLCIMFTPEVLDKLVSFAQKKKKKRKGSRY